MTERRFESAERVHDQEGRQYHVGVAPGEVAQFVMLVGDPGRAELVAGLMQSVELERRNREYVTFTGLHDGLRVSVVGTGMGADNTEIAVIELCQCADLPTIIRCGSCGALQPEIDIGDLVISQGAYRLENTTLAYVGEGYPAVADPEAVLALMQAADDSSTRWHFGITATASGFYGAQGRTIPGFVPRNPEITADLERQGVANFEMEISSLLTLATLRGFRSGAVCAVFASRHRNEFIVPDRKETVERSCVEVGLRAFHHLERMDRQRGSKRRWHPGMAGS